MKALALVLVISLAIIVRSNTRELMVVDDKQNMRASTQQIEAQGDEKSASDQINNHHNIPREDWGNDGGDINN